MTCEWIHEYAEQVILSGVFDNPLLIYDLTPEEIGAYIKGKNERLRGLQKGENIRIGTLCATIYNSNRRKRNDKIWKWSDFFPERNNLREPDVDSVRTECLRIMKMFGG